MQAGRQAGRSGSGWQAASVSGLPVSDTVTAWAAGTGRSRFDPGDSELSRWMPELCNESDARTGDTGPRNQCSEIQRCTSGRTVCQTQAVTEACQ
jgi:hypothetical protein